MQWNNIDESYDSVRGGGDPHMASNRMKFVLSITPLATLQVSWF